MGEISFFGPKSEVNESYLRKIRTGNSANYCAYDFDWFSVTADENVRHIRITAVMPKTATVAELVAEFKKTLRISDQALVWFASSVDYDGPIAYSREKTEYTMISLGQVDRKRNKKYIYQPNFNTIFYQKPTTLSADALAGQVRREWLQMGFYFLPEIMTAGWEQRALGLTFGEVYTGCLTNSDRSAGRLLRDVLREIGEEKICASKRGVSLDPEAYQAYFLLPSDYVMGDRMLDIYGQGDYWKQFPFLEMMMIPESFLKL